MKKNIVICSLFFAALFIISSYQSDKASIQANSSKKINRKKYSHIHKAKHNHGRSIASVNHRTRPNKTAANKGLAIAKVALTKEDQAIVNKVKKNLPNLANSEFKVVKKLKISKKSIYIVNTNKQDHSRSFTALVDNVTGRIEKSWGKTKYEFPQATRHYPVISN